MIWVKTRYDNTLETYIPHNHNIAQAVYGFRELGAELKKYESIDDIYNEVTSDDTVLDYIDQCKLIFRKFNKEINLETYPKELSKHLGRVIWKDRINSINATPEKWGKTGIFVKPVKDKVFTGRVIRGPRDLVGCGSDYEDYEVLCSNPLNILAEWRGFVYYDKLIDIRPYKGDWHIHYDSNTIDSIMNDFIKWNNRPVACSIDFAVIKEENKNKTILLEVNDAYALGCYGLYHLDYAKLISARWSQILDRKDIYHFQ